LLAPLPFSAFAIASVFEARSRRRPIPVALGFLAIAGSMWPMQNDLRRVLDPTFRPFPIEDLPFERAVAAFIAQHAGAADRIYVIPSAPQYYYYVGRSGVDGDYLYTRDEARLRTSLRSGVPT